MSDKNKIVIQKSFSEKLNIFVKTALIILIAIVSLNFIIAIFGHNGFLNNLFKIPAANIDASKGIDKNFNGGLSRKDFDSEQNDPNVPTLDDVFDDLNIIDTDSLVCFYREIKTNNKTIYPNIVFLKTKNGLVFNGATNMIGKQTNYVFGIVNYNVYQNFDKKPYFEIKDSNNFGVWYNNASNLCLFDSGSTCFWNIGGVPLITGGISAISARNYRMELSRDYINKEIVNKYFLKFYNDNVEIFMGSENSIVADFNSFYTYIYNSAVTYNYGEYNQGLCSVDISAPLTIFPIPEEEQNKYPMSNGDNFHCFKVKTYLNCYYEKLSFKNPIKVPEDNLNDETISDCVIEPKSYSTLALTLKTDSNYTEDFLKTVVKKRPVSIVLKNDKGSIVKIINVNEQNFTLPYVNLSCALDNGVYYYTINSNDLDFKQSKGSISIDGSCSLVLSYTYSATTSVSVKLSASDSNFDYSTLKFDKPILLCFKNETDNYSFSFNSFADLLNVKSQELKRGAYNVSLQTNNNIYMDSCDIWVSTSNNTFEFSFTSKPTDLAFDFSYTENQNNVAMPIFIQSNTIEERFDNENFNVEIVFSYYDNLQSNPQVDLVILNKSYEELSKNYSFKNGFTYSKNNLVGRNYTGPCCLSITISSDTKSYSKSFNIERLYSNSGFDFTLIIK